MKRLIFALSLLGILLISPLAAAKLKVVATTSDLAAIAAQIGGQHVEVTALALHSQDPHFVDARPHLALELAKADLLLVVGLDLEIGWLPTLQTGSRNGKIQRGSAGYLECSAFVKTRDAPKGKVDRAQGDVHPGGNPHYMFDPRQAARVSKGIAERLAKLDPSHAAAYKKNAIQLIQSLGKMTKAAETRLAKLRGAKVIAYHKSFPYLADWLGFSIVEHVEPKPGIPPNPHHIARVMAVAKRDKVKVILQESFYPSKVTKMIAAKTGTQLVRVEAAPHFRDGETYESHMRNIVNSLAKAYE
ncbi:MAG TPA: metal ABC transporter substrate-binding protein [Polyangiaceae bacterium]|nr:metal ABC transporter substrate-binding protein [Polyangiaceae bacterium]HMR78539.1 metal ABC transporter substrate-binding protein [Polyangiaceae bacterium]